MPTLADHQSTRFVKMLLAGDPGSGKTGALASLVFAGYRLHIADFDNGLDILANVIRQRDAKLLSAVDYATVTDKYKTMPNRMVPMSANAWGKGLEYIERTLKQKLDEKDVLVIDSLTFAAKAAMKFILKINDRLTIRPYQSDWGEAQNLVENLIAGLYDNDVTCNVICTAHVRTTGGREVDKDGTIISDEPITAFPETVGQALKNIGRYFNSLLMMRTVGNKRQLVTTPTANMDLKTSFLQARAFYSIETGLAEYFTAAKGGASTQTKTATLASANV